LSWRFLGLEITGPYLLSKKPTRSLTNPLERDLGGTALLGGTTVAAASLSNRKLLAR
jgi:hypothetical protein